MIEQAKTSFLNLSHKSLESLVGKARIQEVVFKGFTPEICQQIKVGMQGYQKDLRVEIGEPLGFRAVVISPEVALEPNKPKVGIVFLSGATGTAAGNSPVAAELYQRIPEYIKNEQISMVASLSSSIGVDRESSRFPQSHLERATNEAVFIFELLKNYQADELFIIGQSMAGMELAYMAPMLKSLLRQNDLKTKIGGVVLLVPGGMYNQSLFEFATKRQDKVIGLEGEMEEMFPSIFDRQKVQDKLERAQAQQDAGKIMGAKSELAEIDLKRNNPPNLKEEEKIKLSQIDEALESVENVDGHLTTTLLRQRKELLMPVIKRILKGADTRDKFEPPAKTFLQLEAANFLPGRSGLISPLPESALHALSDVPLALVFGENDEYFKLKEYLNHLADEKIRGNQPLPNSQNLFIAEIAGWPHIGLLTNPGKLASILGDIFERMKKSSNPSQITELKYSGAERLQV